MMLDERTSGVLLHVTSLPGPHGCGDFGPSARHLVDWLHGAGQRLWQLLPMNPVGPGFSPYQSVSAFAGSPLMVALEPLQASGWLPPFEVPRFDERRVDYPVVVPWRLARLREAHAGFVARASAPDRADFDAYHAAQAHWLDDYALFMALERAHGDAGWWHWPEPLASRQPQALTEARRLHADEVSFWQFVQWCFDRQWAAVRAYARERQVAIVGDLPIFVAHHSADIWAAPDQFILEADHQPSVVAGVPPDFFSAVGQRWGNPLYRWSRMAEDGYAWWTARVRRALDHADVFRIDHFRGFAAYWEIPADCPTAIGGRWVEGPGKALFEAIEAKLGPLPIIAEDLGIITPDVEALRDGCGFPGMRILQFAFAEEADHDYLPHRHVPNSVVYTGTHDNDTTLGWWRAAAPRERAFAGTYLACGEHDVHWAMIRAACESVARTAIFPMQDVLGLDGSHRMNVPGEMHGNWGWRFDWGMVGPEPSRVLGMIAAASGRAPLELLRLPAV